jgi:hypothetical protein
VTLKRTAMRRSTRNAATVPARPKPGIPAVVRYAVYSRDNWQCQRCGRLIDGIPFGLQHRTRGAWEDGKAKLRSSPTRWPTWFCYAGFRGWR